MGAEVWGGVGGSCESCCEDGSGADGASARVCTRSSYSRDTRYLIYSGTDGEILGQKPKFSLFVNCHFETFKAFPRQSGMTQMPPTPSLNAAKPRRCFVDASL